MKYLYFPDTFQYAGSVSDETDVPFCLGVAPPANSGPGSVVVADPASGNWVIRAETAAELAAAKTAQTSIINAACNQALAAITTAYPDLEVATWGQQLAEATAYTANNAATTLLLSAIAQASGQAVAALAAGVLQKSAPYLAASGAAIGKRLSLTAQIAGAATVAAVKSISWS
ncbi:hypothetical protein FAZ95_13740 [Trinickia violacea]|uniref:Uncharacterized protein n=1 Tax=Trinickia violacea TaxID=2571746 RepID=A0A4P8IR45_9BURK|nr:hypothetical protein [Trinickia violacea]QCP50145.1 hypothetical protein FAZ95_13740 [Trinickia violacea]